MPPVWLNNCGGKAILCTLILAFVPVLVPFTPGWFRFPRPTTFAVSISARPATRSRLIAARDASRYFRVALPASPPRSLAITISSHFFASSNNAGIDYCSFRLAPFPDGPALLLDDRAEASCRVFTPPGVPPLSSTPVRFNDVESIAEERYTLSFFLFSLPSFFLLYFRHTGSLSVRAFPRTAAGLPCHRTTLIPGRTNARTLFDTAAIVPRTVDLVAEVRRSPSAKGRRKGSSGRNS